MTCAGPTASLHAASRLVSSSVSRCTVPQAYRQAAPAAANAPQERSSTSGAPRPAP